ncbi:EM14S01-3B_G0047960.mRNA.1.CDS.1 [Saccharomyces cerevisiae]|nr:EM14S01-3B_G0047960.mRNA.1.CDS.1 [Saccharomyces cerevisiae]
MVYTLFQVHTLKFNRKDYDTLSLFYLNRGYYNELSFRVLERCYEIASARPNDSSTMRTFTDFVSGAPIVRKGNMDTIWHPTCFCYYTWMSYRFFLHTKQVYLAKRKSTQSGRAWLEKSQSEELTSIWKTILFFKYREIVLPKLRRDTNQMTAALKNKVTVAIDELTVPLMWRIPLPLSRASATRFCRSSAQRIRRRYNKNGSSEPRLKTLDGLTSERWIQWLGLGSDYHCSFSSTRNAEDVVAGEAASSDHHQKISRVT